MPRFHVAQLNVARLKTALDSPALFDFVEALEPINALADAAPGFVWRLQTEDGDATAIRAFEDDMLIVNMSVWESIEALGNFAYRSDHRSVMVRRREWFEQMAEAYLVLWWVTEGHMPTVEEGRARLHHWHQQWWFSLWHGGCGGYDGHPVCGSLPHEVHVDLYRPLERVQRGGL